MYSNRNKLPSLHMITNLYHACCTEDSFGRTPLDYAAYHGRFEALVRLIELNALADTEDPRSSPFNSLIYAACNGIVHSYFTIIVSYEV